MNRDDVIDIVLIGTVIVGVMVLVYTGDGMGFKRGVERVCLETDWQSPTCVKEKERRMEE